MLALGHDKMTLCLAVTHASIFNTPHKALLRLNLCIKHFSCPSYIFTSKHFWQLSKCSTCNVKATSQPVTVITTHSWKFLVLNQCSILVCPVIEIDCENQRRYGHLITKKSARMNIINANKTHLARQL